MNSATNCLINEISYTIFFYFAPFKPILSENLGNFVVVGTNCHIVWKIQISIVIDKLSEDNLKFVLFCLTFHFRHAKIRNANLEKVNCTSLFQKANFYYRT
jgi:hypothetical protein